MLPRCNKNVDRCSCYYKKATAHLLWASVSNLKDRLTSVLSNNYIGLSFDPTLVNGQELYQVVPSCSLCIEMAVLRVTTGPGSSEMIWSAGWMSGPDISAGREKMKPTTLYIRGRLVQCSVSHISDKKLLLRPLSLTQDWISTKSSIIDPWVFGKMF